MSEKNAIKILMQRVKKNPELQAAYIEEKKKYHIACKIRQCRHRNKLTQKELARLIKTKQSVISRLENDGYTSHSLGILKKISEVTNEPLESFLTEDSKHGRNQKIKKSSVPPCLELTTNPLVVGHLIKSLRGCMLEKEWLLTSAPVGILESSKNWKAVAFGVFIYDNPFIWYVTSNVLFNECETSLHVLLRHKKMDKILFPLTEVLKLENINWIQDKQNKIVATLFPANPDFELKAIGFEYFLTSQKMLPAMTCYSVGYPYIQAEEYTKKFTPFVLDGIISRIDEDSTVYVTTPVFSENYGSPLFVWKSPIDSDAISFGSPSIYFGGIITKTISLKAHQGKDNNFSATPLSLNEVSPSKLI